jgi:hypothetical protein
MIGMDNWACSSPSFGMPLPMFEDGVNPELIEIHGNSKLGRIRAVDASGEDE